MKKGIIVALYPEAKKIIETLKMVSLPFSEFSCFASKEQDVFLVISGVGKVASAAATSFLLTQFSCDLVANFGFAGGKGNIGDSFFIDDIIDNATGKRFFPDLSSSLFPKNRAALQTVDFVSTQEEHELLVDMEASAFFEAASYFLPLQNIFVYKMISDNANGEKIDLEKLENFLQKSIAEFLDFFQKYNPEKKSFFIGEDEDLLEDFFQKYRFSVTDERMLKKYFQAIMIQKNQNLQTVLKNYEIPAQENKKQVSKFIVSQVFSDFSYLTSSL